jgi:hypothetical protein
MDWRVSVIDPGPPNGLELRRRGYLVGQEFPNRTPAPSIANRAASLVASSETLGGKHQAPQWEVIFKIVAMINRTVYAIQSGRLNLASGHQ